MLYLALFPTRQDNRLEKAFFESGPNRLAELYPAGAAWRTRSRVIDPAWLPGHRALRLVANTLKQQVVCYVDPPVHRSGSTQRSPRHKGHQERQELPTALPPDESLARQESPPLGQSPSGFFLYMSSLVSFVPFVSKDLPPACPSFPRVGRG